METTTELKPLITQIPETSAIVKVSSTEEEKAKEGVFTQVVALLGGLRTVGAAVCATLVTGVWLSLFTMGIAVPSEPYRTRMLSLAAPATIPDGAPSILESLVVIAFAYTPTNLALLCCAAALVGCLGRMATTNGSTPSPDAGAGADGKDPGSDQGAVQAAVRAEKPAATQPSKAERPDASLLAPAMSAVTWGFFVYLVLISGTIVLTGDPFKETSPEQYFRLAGSASLFAFAVGWQPQILNQLVANVSRTGVLKGSK